MIARVVLISAATVATLVLTGASSCGSLTTTSPGTSSSSSSDSAAGGSAPTSNAATQAPTSAPSPVTKTGHGDSVVPIPAPFNTQPTVVTAKNSGSSNFAVETLKAGNAHGELLVNTIGNYQGVVAMDFDGSNAAVNLQITASDGSWSITFSDPSTAGAFAGTGAAQGDDVLRYGGGSGAATFKNNGQGNFAVVQYGSIGSGGGNLLVNVIGNYDGTVPISAGGFLLITSDGNWSVSVAP